ncbi:MAG: SRPBCC family protein, partial [Gammaproteobacteria bacterium]|nr:SRPBCC family protein [Gammaproteobacteria bacterium]
MNLTLLIVVILIGLVAIAALMMPATTRTTVEIRFDAPIDAVWEVYTDFESQSNWRSDVASVEISE